MSNQQVYNHLLSHWGEENAFLFSRMVAEVFFLSYSRAVKENPSRTRFLENQSAWWREKANEMEENILNKKI